MDDKNDKKREAPQKASEKREGSYRAFVLVVTMLILLFVLILFLLALPLIDKALLDYYKWSFTTLIGAFGAWIGAGAAYFFGKENLQESSASTERAMEIQRKSFQRPSGIERIKDMTLTAMNSNFIFSFDSRKAHVITKLNDFKGFWFVPVVDKITGVLEDIIHARVFWDSTFKDDQMKLRDMVSQMDTTELKKLHGDLFYAKVSATDKIIDVYNKLDTKGAEVAIVVDEKGKASHCVTKTELRTFLKATGTA